MKTIINTANFGDDDIKPLNVGDTFIYISKYGKPYPKGIVDKLISTTSLESDCNYTKLTIISNNGIHYNYNECYKITKVLNEEQIKTREETLNKLFELKKRKSSN